MAICINPQCPNPHNSDEHHFCQACGSELLLQFRYRVIKEIGKGGFGQTYEVKEGNTTKVLKVLINTSTKAVELFKREAGVLKQLNQPSIPKVEPDGYFTFTPRGSQQPLHCLIMEKIVGLNLWDYIRQLGRPIDGDTAKRWLSELITILQPVHEQGFLHRDIKPQNIIFKTDGTLALIDFGAIKEGQDTEVATEASRGSGGTEHATRTTGKTSIQSLGYTPNEQMNGQAILPQSDFYALGRTFIYLLTGREPKNIDYDPLSDKLNWQQYAPNVPSQLADLIDQMSATLVRERPRSFQEIFQQLSGAKRSSTSSTNHSKPNEPATAQSQEVFNQKNKQQPQEDVEEYRKKLQRYEQEFSRAVTTEYPLSFIVGDELKRLWESLGLKKKDVTEIEEWIIFRQTEAKQRENTKRNEQWMNSSSSTNSSTSRHTNSAIDLDLTRQLPLTLYEMKSGVEKQIEVGNEVISVNIPAGVSVGTRIQIRGKGRFDPSTRKSGNLNLTITAAPQNNTSQFTQSTDTSNEFRQDNSLNDINEVIDADFANYSSDIKNNPSQGSEKEVSNNLTNPRTTYDAVIGIDLGTTKSVVSVMHNGKPIIIPNSQEQRSTPTIVAYTNSGQCLIGEAAKRQAVTNPENTFYGFTHLLGCDYSEVTNVVAKVAYQIRNDQGKAKIWCPVLRRLLTPEEILSKFLQLLVRNAEQYLGGAITFVVISVPIHFNIVQREMVIEAARLAELDCLRLISQPSAAAISYGLNKKNIETILIFDMGGGSCNVSLVEGGDGNFEILACAGHTDLGGDDFDKKILNYLVERFRKVEKIDLSNDRQALKRLTEAAEKAKIELCSATRTEINLPFITATQNGSKHLDITLTRVKFEELCSDLFDSCRVLIQDVLHQAKLDKNSIDEIVLIGGSTRIPAVQMLIMRLLDKEPNQRLNCEETVAMGVAVQAGVLSGSVHDILLLDVLTASLGVETLGGEMTKIIPRNTTIPTKKSQILFTIEDNQDNMEIHVVQGEAEMVAQNKSLGKFQISGIPPAPKGISKIEVVFDIDGNGLLVNAKAIGTGKKWSWSPHKKRN